MVSGGIKHDGAKDRFALVPWDALREVARVFTVGATKPQKDGSPPYGERNWEKGLAYSRVFSSTMRHLTDWFQGRMTYDPDGTGLRNIAQAAWGCLVLCAFELRGRDDLDDRPGGPVTEPAPLPSAGLPVAQIYQIGTRWALINDRVIITVAGYSDDFTNAKGVGDDGASYSWSKEWGAAHLRPAPLPQPPAMPTLPSQPEPVPRAEDRADLISVLRRTAVEASNRTHAALMANAADAIAGNVPTVEGLPALTHHGIIVSLNDLLPRDRRQKTMSFTIDELAHFGRDREQTVRDLQERLADIEKALGLSPGTTAPELTLAAIARLMLRDQAVIWLTADDPNAAAVADLLSDLLEGEQAAELKAMVQRLEVKRGNRRPKTDWETLQLLSPGKMTRGQLVATVLKMRARWQSQKDHMTSEQAVREYNDLREDMSMQTAFQRLWDWAAGKVYDA